MAGFRKTGELVDHDHGIFGEVVHGGLVPEHHVGQFDFDGDSAVSGGSVTELSIVVGSGGPDASVFFQGQEVMVACGDFNDTGQGNLAVFWNVFLGFFRPVPAPDGSVFLEDQHVILAARDGLDVVDAFHMDGANHVVGQAAPECFFVYTPSPELAIGGDGEALAHGTGDADDFAALQGIHVDFIGTMATFRIRRAPVVTPSPEDIVLVNGDSVGDGGACHRDIVEYFGRDGCVGVYVVATPESRRTPCPEGIVFFDGKYC